MAGKKFVCTVTVKKASAAANKLAKNYAKVRNYINKNGRYSEDGSKYIEASIDAETTAILSYDTKSDKLDMGLSLQIKKEGIISAMDILVNCAKSDSARVISGIYASGNAVYTTATMRAPYTMESRILYFIIQMEAEHSRKFRKLQMQLFRRQWQVQNIC